MKTFLSCLAVVVLVSACDSNPGTAGDPARSDSRGAGVGAPTSLSAGSGTLGTTAGGGLGGVGTGTAGGANGIGGNPVGGVGVGGGGVGAGGR